MKTTSVHIICWELEGDEPAAGSLLAARSGIARSRGGVWIVTEVRKRINALGGFHQAWANTPGMMPFQSRCPDT
jgi:hypothetical protein